MVDYVKIHIKAGNGGNGHVSFMRLRGKPYGPADGGDGGDGGNVYLIAKSDLSTLIPYRYKKDFKAENGSIGGKNHKRGSRGDDLYLSVPAGTLVKNEKEQVLIDITDLNAPVLVAKGGKGGRGNAHAKMSDIRHQTSEIGHLNFENDKWEALKKAEEGKPGEEEILILELKLLADVGIIGLPNAGKSTLLSKLTLAHPKIASYPFTTLEPNLGVMEQKGKDLVLADIPGLIEGASRGRGLGDQFLRHVERTKLLIHLISASSDDPAEEFETINKELGGYHEDLSKKPQIVVLNKIDLVNKEQVNKKVKALKAKKIKVMLISAVTNEGLERLKDEIISRI